MQYPHLRQKIEILERKYRLDPALIAKRIQKDKSTAWRWLHQSTDRLSQDDQRLLVTAICELLAIGLTEKEFKGNSIKTFCERAGLTRLEAALHSGNTPSIPDIIANSVFDMSGNATKYVGKFLIFRHDKEKTDAARPYIQACGSISINDYGWPVYEDLWADAFARISYAGNIYHFGRIVSIIGGVQNASRGIHEEMWWSGLKTGSVAQDGTVTSLYGYVSDLTREGVLYTDRILLIRVSEEEWNDVNAQRQFFVSRNKVGDIAGERLTQWLERWKDIPIDEPARV